MRTTAATRTSRMGYYLAREYGSSYHAFGFEFGRGGFRALDVSHSPAVLTNFALGAPFQSSVGWLMKRSGRRNSFVDSRGAPSSGPAAEWFGRPLRTRMIGNGYYAPNISAIWKSR